MKRFALFVLSVFPTSAFADYWFCEYTVPGGNAPTSYYSEVFATGGAYGSTIGGSPMGTDSGPPAMGSPGRMAGSVAGPSKRAMGDAFAKFISGNMPLGSASCDSS